MTAGRSTLRRFFRSADAMALFRPDSPDGAGPAGFRSTGNPAEQHTIIGVGTTLDGTLNAQGNLNVAGTIRGDLGVQGRAMIVAGGTVEGGVSATTAEVAGHIAGALIVRERLVLRPTAVIDGDIRAGALVIEDGAVFNGRCEMGPARPTVTDGAALLLDGSARSGIAAAA